MPDRPVLAHFVRHCQDYYCQNSYELGAGDGRLGPQSSRFSTLQQNSWWRFPEMRCGNCCLVATKISPALDATVTGHDRPQPVSSSNVEFPSPNSQQSQFFIDSTSWTSFLSIVSVLVIFVGIHIVAAFRAPRLLGSRNDYIPLNLTKSDRHARSISRCRCLRRRIGRSR